MQKFAAGKFHRALPEQSEPDLALGWLKPFGLTISILAASVSTVAIAYEAIASGGTPAPEIVIGTGVVWVLAAIWTFVVTPSWVRVPADAYGMQLLAACDTLDADGEKPARKLSARSKK
jgi:hypothetical protein